MDAVILLHILTLKDTHFIASCIYTTNMYRLLFLALLSLICWNPIRSESSTLPLYIEEVADIQKIRPEAKTSTVFKPGSIPHSLLRVRTSIFDSTSPPKPLLIASPTATGVYPVILFCHGFMLQNNYYSSLLSQIASHGYIVVAPQFYSMMGMFTPQYQEIEAVGEVTDWMFLHLQSRLPTSVEPELSKIALVGHSRGGKTAFASALGYAKTELRYSLIVGIDPVAGRDANSETSPEILTRESESFNLSMPAIVIGTGLGPERLNRLTPPCAPNGVNHRDFYYESKPAKAHFVTPDYGHMDMLDDSRATLLGWTMCRGGRGSRGPMRRTVSGLVVAFSNQYLKDEYGDVEDILANPGIAPAKLQPFEFVPAATSKTFS